jgi:hypothetical protein
MAAVEYRVIGPDALDKAAVARTARIGDDDTVIGSFFGPAAGEADL